MSENFRRFWSRRNYPKSYQRGYIYIYISIVLSPVPSTCLYPLYWQEKDSAPDLIRFLDLKQKRPQPLFGTPFALATVLKTVEETYGKRKGDPNIEIKNSLFSIMNIFIAKSIESGTSIPIPTTVHKTVQKIAFFMVVLSFLKRCQIRNIANMPTINIIINAVLIIRLPLKF